MMMEIAVLQIDHHGPAATISKVFSKNWTALDLALAVNEKMIAVVLANMYDATAFLLFWKFDDTIFHRIPLVADDENVTQPQSLIYEDDIYFGRQGLDSFAAIGRIRTFAVANDLKLATRKPFPVHALERNTCIDTYNLRSLKRPAGADEVHILHFWPAEVTKSPLDAFGVGVSDTCTVIIDDANTIGLMQCVVNRTTQTTFQSFRLPEAEVDCQSG
ncbi:hypothetical protein C8R44DRAFT_723466 [Mycena epipterygia]|nr:hypothetical protein C8R44DRAFT_723466 [Mycena epipterygia]